MVRITDMINKPIRRFANSGLIEKVCKHYRADDGKYIAAFSVGALIAKDAYNCGIYVMKNEQNKNIPPEQKKFISLFDVSYFALTTAVQLLAYATIAKKATQEKIFNKVVGRYFNSEKIAMIEKKLQAKFPEISPKEIEENINKYKANVELTFEHLFSLIVTTIFAKRILAPFLATPLAEDVEKKFFINS